MTEDSVRDTSELLWRLWSAGETIEALPAELMPTTRREGYAVQAGLDARSAMPRVGWKLAATSGAGQRHIGVDQSKRIVATA